MSSEYVVIFVTVPNKDVGVELARHLVSNRLVACVNVVDGLKSIYYWEGRVEEDNEALLIIKSRKDRLDDIINAVRGKHPYKVPEIIALPIIGGLKDYLAWIDEVVGTK
ncbi:MAG: divalent-cation tolerance protein CutA [Vulcanisaeta sp.]|jgi:periplasmic divalent cation tolerance protein|nr:divalent-cation tolerance protein CutA [Vulcanisaeta sp.]PVU70613.1 divalent-cation tolerance protein CutA [Vulcanisaeta sp. SCGC AB-777_J10]MCG2867211.1 divalent-cation tolerance protein CutA [Vulcanisaeta sp.]MCG2885157.1 divalent-cation tolerance protein CutA [Vulcanisaeta sp.]MDT7863507.1 divalent-cation tolerance protein CutA [Vulcanisaeta sp.]